MRHLSQVRLENDDERLQAVEQKMYDEAGQQTPRVGSNDCEEETQQTDGGDYAYIFYVLRDVQDGEEKDDHRDRPYDADPALQSGIKNPSIDDLFHERRGHCRDESERERGFARTAYHAINRRVLSAETVRQKPSDKQQADGRPNASPETEILAPIPAERTPERTLAEARHDRPR